MKHRPLKIVLFVLLIGSIGCRAPESSEIAEDSENGSEADSASDLTDGGVDAGAPLDPCAPHMDPALGLLPENSPHKGGEASVDVVVNVFSNLRCSHCARLAEIIDILWQRPEWNSRVRLYFRHMPLSFEVHAATVAAFNQGEDDFWALHDEIFYRLRENGDYMTVPDILDYAETVLNLDMTRFEEDMASEETTNLIEEDRAVGEALGVTVTPSVFICDERIETADLEDAVMSYL